MWADPSVPEGYFCLKLRDWIDDADKAIKCEYFKPMWKE
jgi:hypothetical protein